jgi:hypothetical protein
MKLAVLGVLVTSLAHAAPLKLERDPKIVALADRVKKCIFDANQIDPTCPPYRAFLLNVELFVGGKGDDTLFAFAHDRDPLLRALAEAKTISDPARYFSDKPRATALLALAAARPDATSGLGVWVGHVDAQALGLTAELHALAAHPSQPFRVSLATHVLRFATPAAIELARRFLAASDWDVNKRVFEALAVETGKPHAPEVCQLLAAQLTREDQFVGLALLAGTTSACELREKVTAELLRRTKIPKKIDLRVAGEMGRAARAVCSRSYATKLPAKVFLAAKAMTHPAAPIEARRAGLVVMPECDAPKAIPVLTRLTRDKDPEIRRDAKRQLKLARDYELGGVEGGEGGPSSPFDP